MDQESTLLSTRLRGPVTLEYRVYRVKIWCQLNRFNRQVVFTSDRYKMVTLMLFVLCVALLLLARGFFVFCPVRCLTIVFREYCHCCLSGILSGIVWKSELAPTLLNCFQAQLS